MLWLILAIILFVIAIAGGAIVHPILFALAIVALILAVHALPPRASGLLTIPAATATSPPPRGRR